MIPPTDVFTQAEAAEAYPGGSATHTKRINRDAFSQASSNMSFEREIDFKVGNGFFKRLWVTAPASTQAADGLGPLYNARSCQRCHLKDGRGHPPNGPEDNAVSMFLRLSIPPQNEAEEALLREHRVNNIPDPVYGAQLQDFAIAGHKAEGQMRIDYEALSVELADGETVQLRKPTYRVASLGYGPLHPQIRISPRVAPQMIGLGLLEAIDEADILQQADPDDVDGDGISGRPNLVWSSEHQRVMLGRFGHKAGMPSVNEQSQGAFSGDIGISVPLHPSGAGECSENQTACREAPDGNSPQYEDLEAESGVTDLVVFYARNLAVPARRRHDSEPVLAGKKIFYEIGCIACHTPKYRTPAEGVAMEQSDQLIWPYTDLLLHDMGEGLADHRPEGVANGREWRTAPLWGIGLTPDVNGHSNYLHDGRARNLLEAILWHGGEAQTARDALVRLPKREREYLLRFVESL
ncbi:MAG: di-heme oxidoredictase family protein [Candidatus Thiodiazotropha sp.]